MTRKICYDQDINALEFSYRFKTQGWDNNLRCITFTRIDEQDETHEVTLEDHRDDEKIHDWLIFSSLKNSTRDWYGYVQDEQYPLELGAYRLFARLVSSIEQLYPLENSESHIMSETE